MKRFLARLLRGIGVLWGAVTLVFLIFSMGADPVEGLVSENTSASIKQSIRRKYDLDLPTFQRYALFVNGLSPLSLHNPAVPESRIHWNQDCRGYRLFAISDYRVLYIKYPMLGRSFVSDRPVARMLSEALPGTALLALTAMLLALSLGLTIGILSAVYRDSLFDRLGLVLSALGMSGPSFFMAMIIAWLGGWVWYETTSLPVLPFALPLLFAAAVWLLRKRGRTSVRLGSAALWGGVMGLFAEAVGVLTGFSTGRLNLPGTGLSMSGSLLEVDVWKGPFVAWGNLILPAITLGIRPLAVIAQLMRNALLDVLAQDYIRTARAKGLSTWRVVMGHGVRNALNPVITAVSGWFASMLAGAVFVEYVFGWRGLGLTTYQALEQNDMPVVMGAVILIAAIFTAINAAVDVVYGWVDPRVR